MVRTLNDLPIMDWLKLNAQLQSKKNGLRKALKEKGVLKREGKNEFGKGYKYFSEAQYKELFTELLSNNNLELKFDEVEYETFEGPEKQANGRMPKLKFVLFDCETGFYEETTITGEGIDVGDKAGYKAYTGALKYYLANTFMVATGDDPEKETIEQKMNTKANVRKQVKATDYQVKKLAMVYTGENLAKLLAANNITKIEDLPMEKADTLIRALEAKANG